ncbi:MAG: RsmE family RNA methyltransferase [Weeksellaceae bacterium]
MNLFLAHIQDNNALITDSESHHLQKVLRKKVGEQVMVTDGKGKIFTGVISNIESKNVLVDQLVPYNNTQHRKYHIEVAIAPTKQIDRTEFFLEKAIEIGLDAVHPIITFHSERRKLNQDRLERVGLAAMKQSLKAELTKVNSLISFDDLLEQLKDYKGQKFIAHCDSDIKRIPLKEIIKPNDAYIFLIGPEGDFSKEEIKKATDGGYISISLGNQRMRTETAALACVAGVHWLHQ